MAISASASIDYSNTFSQAHANVFNLINNRNNVADPLDSKGRRKFVYVREPRVSGRGFADYPIIIISPVDVSQTNAVVSATKSITNYSISIQVLCIDGTFPAIATATGAEQLNTISNSILQTLNNETNRTILRNYGLKNFELNSSPSDYDDMEGNLIFMREFELTFSEVLKITA